MIKRKKFPVYWTGLGIYTVILLIACGFFLSYADKSLVQYENSQPEKAMESYMAEFEKMAADGTLYDYMEMPKPSAFEGADVYKELYRARLEEVGEYTFAKDGAGYIADRFACYIYGDGKPVAKAELSPSNEHTIFGMLTIMDWNIEALTPVLEAASKDYVIRIPDNYKATLNGAELGAENRTGTVIENPEFANAAAYVKMPVIVEYQVSGLLKEPEIKVFDADGSERKAAPDEDGNIVVADYTSPMPKERYDDALKMAQAWENFLTRDLGGADNGLGNIRKYLIKDSYYWGMANEYAHGADITYISGHTLANPPYSNIKISDYVSYGENCYSCHIYFEKNMILEYGAPRVDVINSTFYFVKYDDSDDGVDNPHWAIVDMIAKVDA